MDKNTQAQVEILSDVAETLCKEAIGAADCLDRLAETLDHFRARLVDVPAARDEEQAKRSMIDLWDEQAVNLRLAADIVRRGPIDGETLAKEIREALCLRVKELAGAAALSEVVDILSERANNIAAAYRGRVAREPK